MEFISIEFRSDAGNILDNNIVSSANNCFTVDFYTCGQSKLAITVRCQLVAMQMITTVESTV